MPGDPFRSVAPGQKLEIPAAAYNAFLDAARHTRGRLHDTGRDEDAEFRQTGIVKLVLSAIRGQAGEFRLADIERACPGVGRDWIRALLGKLRARGEVVCKGKGPAARWSVVPSKGSTPK